VVHAPPAAEVEVRPQQVEEAVRSGADQEDDEVALDLGRPPTLVDLCHW